MLYIRCTVVCGSYGRTSTNISSQPAVSQAVHIYGNKPAWGIPTIYNSEVHLCTKCLVLSLVYVITPQDRIKALACGEASFMRLGTCHHSKLQVMCQLASIDRCIASIVLANILISSSNAYDADQTCVSLSCHESTPLIDNKLCENAANSFEC